MPELITEEGSGEAVVLRGVAANESYRLRRVLGSRIDAIVRLVDGEIPDSTTAYRATDARGAAIFLRGFASSWRGCDDGVVALA